MLPLRTAALAFCVSATASLYAQDRLPDVEIATLEGEAVNVRDLAGGDGPTVIAFWATWCAPCKQELAAYSAAYAAWRADYGAEVVAVSIDDARQLRRVAPMAEEKGWAFPVVSDAEGKLPAALGFRSIPQVYVVAADGSIAYAHAGYTPGDEEAVAEALAELTRG